MGGYGRLSRFVGGFFLAVGTLVLVGFAAALIGRAPDSPFMAALNGPGLYFFAFTGTTTFVWGAVLWSTARSVEAARAVRLPTVIGLALMALFRIGIWSMNAEVRELVGALAPVEAVIFGSLGVAFAVMGRSLPGADAAAG